MFQSIQTVKQANTGVLFKINIDCISINNKIVNAIIESLPALTWSDLKCNFSDIPQSKPPIRFDEKPRINSIKSCLQLDKRKC